jgi:putative transposase
MGISIKGKREEMPGPKAEAIELTEAMQKELGLLEKGHKTGQQIAKRARIIRLAASGHDNPTIGRLVGVNRNTVSLWRKRWLKLEAIPPDDLSAGERLEDLPRPGAPARITAEQRCQLEAMACEPPAESGRPISQWTGREIADEMIKRNIVDTISPRHAARLLKICLNSPSHEPLLAEYREG